jgi:hypothetical protein
MKVGSDLVEQSIKIPQNLYISVLTKAWYVLLRPMPSLHCLFKELASKVKCFLQCKLAFVLKYVNRVVGDDIGFSLETVNLGHRASSVIRVTMCTCSLR